MSGALCDISEASCPPRLTVQALPVATDAAAAKQWRAPAFNFYDARLLGGAWRGAERPDIVREFFRVLSVCHTVIPDGVPLNLTPVEHASACCMCLLSYSQSQ